MGSQSAAAGARPYDGHRAVCGQVLWEEVRLLEYVVSAFVLLPFFLSLFSISYFHVQVVHVVHVHGICIVCLILMGFGR